MLWRTPLFQAVHHPPAASERAREFHTLIIVICANIEKFDERRRAMASPPDGC